MTDYTPTEKEVRNGYVGAGSEPNPYVSEDERAEFDRWLAEHDAQIVEEVMDTERAEQKQWFTLLASILYSHDGAVKVSDMELDKYSIEISEDRINYTRTIKLVPYQKEKIMAEIPTTAQVRHGYSIADGGLNDSWLREDAEKRFDRWFAEELRKAKAEGFYEGWDARVNAETITPTENPYRQGETE